MGLDARIYFSTDDGQAPELCDSLPNDCEIEEVDDDSCHLYAPTGSTHEVYQVWRYYSLHYERGPWPKIAAVLMSLLACRNVDTVWYGSDGQDGVTPVSPQKVLEISAHYMKFGDRPYRKPFTG